MRTRGKLRLIREPPPPPPPRVMVRTLLAHHHLLVLHNLPRIHRYFSPFRDSIDSFLEKTDRNISNHSAATRIRNHSYRPFVIYHTIYRTNLSKQFHFPIKIKRRTSPPFSRRGFICNSIPLFDYLSRLNRGKYQLASHLSSIIRLSDDRPAPTTPSLFSPLFPSHVFRSRGVVAPTINNQHPREQNARGSGKKKKKGVRKERSERGRERERG